VRSSSRGVPDKLSPSGRCSMTLRDLGLAKLTGQVGVRLPFLLVQVPPILSPERREGGKRMIVVRTVPTFGID